MSPLVPSFAALLLALAPAPAEPPDAGQPQPADSGSALTGDPARDREILARADSPEDALALLPGAPVRAAEIVSTWVMRNAGAEAATAPADARILRVGGDRACDHRSVQDAIDEARPPPATTVIRVARNAEHTNQALQINDRNVILEGGHASCAAGTPQARNTVLDGSGNGNRPVIRIRNQGDSRIEVALHRLAVQGGATTTNYFICSESRRNGAGLNIRGRVLVTLTNTVVRDNATISGSYSGVLCGAPNSNSGGGVYFDGEGFGDIMLRLDSGSSVVNNAAQGKGRFDHMHGQGGGIFCKSGRVALAHGNTAIAGNRTGGDRPGDGGGVYLNRDCTFRSSAGGPLSGVLFNESAKGGGGIFTQTGRVRFDAAGETFRPAVAGNSSAEHGGGIYVRGERDVVLMMRLGGVRLSSNRSGGSGGGIYFFGWRSSPEMVDAVISGNLAQQRGGGVHFGSGELVMRRSGTPCPGSEIDRCSRLADNHAEAHGGALSITSGEVRLTQTVIAGNSAEGLGSVAWVRGGGAELHMEGVAIHGNHGSSRLFQLENRSLTSLDWSTIAGNRRAGDPPLQVFRVYNEDHAFLTGNTRLRVRGSIVWEPGATMAHRTGRTFTPSNCTIGHVNLADSGLSVGSRFYSRINPRLKDPDDGDLRLRPNSPAIDYCSSGEAGLRPRHADLYGNRRGMPYAAPTITPPNAGSGDFDLGVHEASPETE